MNKLNLIVTRKYTVLVSDLYIRGLSQPSHYKQLYHLDNTFMTCGIFWDQWCYGPEISQLGETLFEKEQGSPGFIQHVFDTIYAYGEELLDCARDINLMNFSEKSDDELHEAWKKFRSMLETYVVGLSGYGLQAPVERRLRELLEGRPDLDEELAILSFPEKMNIMTVEQRRLLEIGAMIQRGDISNPSTELTTLLEGHVHEYGWTNTRGGSARSWVVADVEERLKSVLQTDCAEKIRELEQDTMHHQSESRALIEKMNLDEETRKLVAIAKELVYFRTYRTDYLACAFAWARPLIEDIAKREGATYEEVSALRVEEFEQWKNIDAETKKHRDEWFAIVAMAPDNIAFCDRKEDEQAWREKYLNKEEQTQDIKGAIAYRGIVRGKVKKVLSKKDIAAVEHGDIIVASMTTPDMVPAMEKAFGFVTDEGGITCHAAIIAREMKKPCVIGTKHATRILNDGDMVEVNANTGEVVKI